MKIITEKLKENFIYIMWAVVSIICIVIKLCGWTTAPWTVVLAPLWMPMAFVFAILGLMVILALILDEIDKRRTK